MVKIVNKTFHNESVTVDGKDFSECTFTNTVLIYAAGEVPSFSNCTFDAVALEFEGAATHTLQFLSGLYRGGFSRSVEAVFDTIREKKG